MGVYWNEDDLSVRTPNTPGELRQLSDEDLFGLLRVVAFANQWASARSSVEATGRQIAA